MKYIALITLFASTLMSLPSLAQNPKIDIRHLNRLISKADQHAEVSLSGATLRFAAKAMSKSSPELSEAIKDIKSISVLALGFSKDGSFSQEDIEQIKRQIVIPPWEQLVIAKQKGSGDVGVYVLIDPRTDILQGLVVLAAQDRQLAFVNIVGNIDPEKLHMLSGKMGVPELPQVKRE